MYICSPLREILYTLGKCFGEYSPHDTSRMDDTLVYYVKTTYIETRINSHQRNGKKCVWNLCLLACKNVSLILRHQRHVLNKRVLDEESSHTRCESGHQMRLVVLGQTTIWSKFVASHAVFVQQILIYDFYICNKNLWQGELIVPTDAWIHQPIYT